MQTNTSNMLPVWSKVFVLFVELFPSTGVLWVIGVRLHANCLHISILYINTSWNVKNSNIFTKASANTTNF